MRTDEARALLRAERAHLELARDALLAHAGPDGGTQREDTGELSGMDEHMADVASDTFEREFDLGLLHTIQAELDAVDIAVASLTAGTYGRCRACGTEIGDARLRALPAATFCIAHQGDAEGADSFLRGSILHGGIELEAAAHLDLLPSEYAVGSTSAEEGAMHLLEP